MSNHKVFLSDDNVDVILTNLECRKTDLVFAVREIHQTIETVRNQVLHGQNNGKIWDEEFGYWKQKSKLS